MEMGNVPEFRCRLWVVYCSIRTCDDDDDDDDDVCVVAVNRLKSEHNVEIPSDADTTAVRIEGSREGVASAKAELQELVDKMVSQVVIVVVVVAVVAAAVVVLVLVVVVVDSTHGHSTFQ